jgi:Dynein heavy chain, N-terminal region 1
MIWNAQVKHCLVASTGPLAEIRFWQSRSVDLSGIRDQLDHPVVARVCAVLEAAKSRSQISINGVAVWLGRPWPLNRSPRPVYRRGCTVWMVVRFLSLLKRGSYYWLPNRDRMSYSACQIGPNVSHWFQLCAHDCHIGCHSQLAGAADWQSTCFLPGRLVLCRLASHTAWPCQCGAMVAQLMQNGAPKVFTHW